MTMRRKANMSLIALTILFFIALLLNWKLEHPWWASALLFIAEAGMVGALADWFAVTALFRHPLGAKWIPHTAIVPRNRNKLIDGVVYLVQEQLLNKTMITTQINKLKLVDIIIRWVDQRWSLKTAEKLIVAAMPYLLKNVKVEQTSSKIDQLIIDVLRNKEAAPQIKKGMNYLIKQGYDQKLIDLILDTVQKRLLKSDVKPAIKSLLEDKTASEMGGNWLTKALFSLAKAADAVNFDDAADIIYRDLILLLSQLKDHDHELRIVVQKQLQQLVVLLDEEDIAVAVEQWKQQLINELSFSPFIQGLMKSLLQQLQMDTEQARVEASTLQKWIARLLHQYWNWFKQDTLSQQMIDEQLKAFLEHLIHQEHKVIGQIVRSTLDTFSEERLVEFIESKVDIDLQRIRVNGALIGAVIGAILYALLHGVYTPLLEMLQS